MAKNILYFGVAVATDITSPAAANILAIGAVHSQHKFLRNVTPQRSVVETEFWSTRPQERAALGKGAVPVGAAMVEFHKWLKKFQGTLVPVTTITDYSILVEAFRSANLPCPFSMPVDVHTFDMAVSSATRPTGLGRKYTTGRPLLDAATRMSATIEPRFGWSRMTDLGMSTAKVKVKPSAKITPVEFQWRG